MNYRIVILNYNGSQLLRQCLPSICEAVKAGRFPGSVTVLDNQSCDESEDYVRSSFSEVEFVKSPTNRVFCSYNQYVKSVSEECVILLNNDIRVEPDFADRLVEVLQSDPDALFVAPQSRTFDGGEYEGSLSKMEFRWGLLWGSGRFENYRAFIDQAGLSMQCGFGAFRRSFFTELEGFDDLYLPGTVEDADLCFRGYRRGWKGYYCPASVVYHIGQASFKKAYGANGLKRINRRNLYLFTWKNIRDRRLLLQHLCLVPFHVIKYLLSGEFYFLLGFWDALSRLPYALERRRKAAQEASIRRDGAIFELSRQIGRR